MFDAQTVFLIELRPGLVSFRATWLIVSRCRVALQRLWLADRAWLHLDVDDLRLWLQVLWDALVRRLLPDLEACSRESRST